MNFQTQSAFVAAIISLTISFTLLSRGARNSQYRSCALLSLSIFVWNICYFYYNTTHLTVWNRLIFAGTLFIPGNALLFAFSHLPTLTKWHRHLIQLIYLVGLAFLITVPTSLFNSPIWSISVMAFIFPVVLIALGVFYRQANKVNSIYEKRRLQFLAWGGFIATLLGPTDFLPGLGIPFPQLGTVAILAYLYAVATGILRDHLFDLPEIFGKGIFLLLEISILGIIFSFLTIFLNHQINPFLLSTISVIFFFLLIEPVQRQFNENTIGLFIKDYPVFQRNLKNYSDYISKSANFKMLENTVQEIFEKLPGVKRARLITNNDLYYKIFSQDGGPILQTQDQLFHGVILPLKNVKERVGVIEIEEKDDHSPYSNREVEAFMVLANQVAAVLVNLRIQDEMKKKEKLAVVGELAAGLAHEIRNPLGVIKGAVQYLNNEVDSRKIKEYFGIILEEVNRLNHVVSEFLDYARPFKKEIIAVNMDDLVQNIIGNLRLKNIPGSVEVKLEIQKDLPLIEVDPDQIKQVFYNLLINGIESMPNGGKMVITSHLIPGQGVEIAIEDTGSGIPQENLGRIFQPFFTTRKNGTGLGLAICYRIIEGHNGSILVESQLGQGSLFRIRLPIKQIL